MRKDFFNEAIVTAMLAAASDPEDEAPRAEAEGEDLTRADALQDRLVALLDRARGSAVQAGMPKELAEAADFAVCAFVDEILLSSASWRGRAEWLKKPLQFARHGTATAGEDFYRLLDALLEEAEKKTPLAPPPPDGRNTAPPPVAEPFPANDPLRAVLEIFALCLAQGFSGMLYGNAAAIRDKLDKIGLFVPAVARRSEPFSFLPVEKAKKKGVLRKSADLIRRFDPLDWLLWIIPPALTALFYSACEARLDQLLQPFLQGRALP